MIKAPALRKRCPYCGHVKKLSNIVSGNTSSGKSWSDTRSFFPMLPQNSPVQKCPRCGKYYFLKDAEDAKRGNRLNNWLKSLLAKDKIYPPGYDPFLESGDDCNETGDLSFEEAKEAFYQLYESASDERKFLIRLLIVYAYNDGIREHRMYSDEKDRQFFIENCLAMTKMQQTNGTLKAELFREAGMFKQCTMTIYGLERVSEYENSVREMIAEKAMQKDSDVFLL